MSNVKCKFKGGHWDGITREMPDGSIFPKAVIMNNTSLIPTEESLRRSIYAILIDDDLIYKLNGKDADGNFIYELS